MAITPQPGWQIDPNNSNGVIPIPGYATDATVVAPYTPAEVAAAASAANPKPTSTGVEFGPPSPFSSGNLVQSGMSTNSSVSSATTALTTPPTTTPPVSMAVGVGTPGTPGYQTVQVTPNKQYQYQLPNGQIISVTDPTINTSALAGAKFLMGPSGSEADPLIGQQGATQGQGGIPTGYSVQGTGSTGATTYTTANGQTALVAPAGTANVGQLLTLHQQAQNDLNTAIPGSQLTMNADGSGVITMPDGTKQNVGSNTIASWASSGSTVTGAINDANTANTAASAQANAQISTINTQLTQSLQELGEQQDAAVAEELAASGGGLGSNAGAVSDVKTRYDELIQNAKDQAADEIATINSNLASAKSTNLDDLTKSLTQIEQSAQSTAIGLSQTAQSNFLASTKSFDVTTLPGGTSMGDLTVGANGTTGVAGVDAIIQQGVKGGYTPQQSLGLLQLGVATQQKADVSTTLSLLKNLTLPDLSNTKPEDMLKDPYIASLATLLTPTLGSQSAALSALQSTSIGQLQATKIQEQTLEVEAQTAKAQIDAALAPEKVADMQMSQAISEASKLNTDNFKAGSWGATMLAIANYIPNIESAYESGGKGVSALTAIDALVKIDTGGQAVRQGQTNLLQESGTWGDSASRFMASLGLPSNTGANTVLTPQQMQQVYNLAKQTAAEKISSVSGAYQSYKTGIETLKTAYPQAQDEIDGASSNIAQIDQFMQQYGSDLNTTGGASTGSTYNGITLPN